jgi:hypothetical protein
MASASCVVSEKGVRCVDGSQDVCVPKEAKKDCYPSIISTFER